MSVNPDIAGFENGRMNFLERGFAGDGYGSTPLGEVLQDSSGNIPGVELLKEIVTLGFVDDVLSMGAGFSGGLLGLEADHISPETGKLIPETPGVAVNTPQQPAASLSQTMAMHPSLNPGAPT